MSKWRNKTKKGFVVSSEIKFGQFQLSVHYYVACKNDWFMSCPGIFSQVPLNATTVHDAKFLAKNELQTILEDALESILNS